MGDKEGEREKRGGGVLTSAPAAKSAGSAGKAFSYLQDRCTALSHNLCPASNDKWHAAAQEYCII